jgi:hypothetical protein
LQKCKAFFLPAAKDAGITISGRILTGRKPRSTNGPKRRIQNRTEKPTPAPKPTVTVNPPPPAKPETPSLAPPNSYQLLAMFDPESMTPEEQAAIWLLIQYAKKKETATK